ncbi:MAG: Rpn family recombination-promoting nuclease/putative transposase [Fibrobacter sp.]|uniref:Rpn family recombination-promoting nuclease/putative transposase n=1 Tax=Fibrobacter sp. TaxID=35828 RepID=UPI0025BF6327|nr:Rpn family recombination-promoting nuclease/putative transposase [Fibrobacter sp.]MBQ7080273.1 Rpn family recombination-promoting nuclease/putative transposase [Fibrobacter sp.]
MNQGQILFRNHDGFFHYVYGVPKNAKTLLNICRKNSHDLDRILSDVDLDTLVRLPGSYNEVGERGEADIAFKAHILNGGEINVGILMEHKSKRKKNVLNQVGRYALRVIMDHDDEIFSWIPTKAVIIYNGPTEWDPLAEFRKKARAKFQGNELPFECVLVNLANIDESVSLESDTPSAAIGAIAMKYAFNPEGFKAVIPIVEKMLQKMPSDEQTTLIEKIILYLGEYIDEFAVEELQMAWKSIGQRMGFVSAGDARRAAEKEGRRDGFKKGHAEGHAEGHAKGRAEGRAEGRTEGHAEGLTEGQNNAFDAMRKIGIPEEKIQEAKALLKS